MKKAQTHLVFIAVVLLWSMPQADDNYYQWSSYRDITLNTTATGVLIGDNQINFPLLIRLTLADSFVFNHARNNGEDIRFAKFNFIDTHFPYQIEYWDKTSMQAVIWVLVDTVKKETQLPLARMYWGKTDAADRSQSTAVFDASANQGFFQAVWHMNDSTGDTLRDATLNRYKGTPGDYFHLGAPQKTQGIIGFGKVFADSGAYYDIINSNSGKLNFDTSAAYSISAWVNMDSIGGTSRHFISKSLNQYNLFCRPNGNLAFSESRGGASRKYVQNDDSINGGITRQWRYVVGVHKRQAAAAMLLYVDGVLASDLIVSSGGSFRSTINDVMLGRRPDFSGEWFKGIMDEVRMENTARGPDWIKLCYETQKNNSAVVLGDPSTVIAPITLHYLKDTLALKAGSAMDSIVPVVDGIVDSFRIEPPLPDGLSFNASSGSISGTPMAESALTQYVIFAMNQENTAQDTITISVNVAPTIVAQPDSVNRWERVKSHGVQFSVQAAGTAPMTFAWSRNGDTIPSAKKDTLTLDTIRRKDDGAVFVCGVTNIAGSTQSAACTLHVVAAAFDVKSDSGIDTLTAVFTDSSTGNSAASPLRRTWYFGDGDSSHAVDTVHFYSKPDTCTVKLVVAAHGVADTATKTVAIKKSSLIPGFMADTLYGSGSLKVTFTDSSKGKISKRAWFFGDSTTVADSSTVTHTFKSIGRYTVKLVVSNPWNSDSVEKSNYITVRPLNPIKLSTRPLSSSSMLLTWDRVKEADSVQVVYTSAGPIPYDLDTVPDDFVKKNMSAKAVFDTVKGLKPKKGYYFGARVFSKKLWSFFTDSSTAEAALSPDTGIVALDPLILDSATNAITIKWRIDTSMAVSDSMDVGIFWSTRDYLEDAESPDTIHQDTIKKNAKIVDSCTLQFGDDFLYDTAYFFTLALRLQGKAWFAISDSSKRELKTPAFTRQNISYGVNHPVAYANNKRVRIAINPATFSTGADDDTIAHWKQPDTLPGFIPMSEGFMFCKGYKSDPLDIGVKYFMPPKGHSLEQVKMFRLNKDNQWQLERSPQWLDSAEGYIVVTTGDIDLPFIAMIDTIRPAVTLLHHTDQAVSSGEEIADSFTVSDNIANAFWSFKYAKGGYAFDSENGDSGILSTYDTAMRTLIPGSFVSADQGIRAIMMASDGTDTTVVDVSRRVIREAGSVVVTDSMKWVPLFVTAQLDSPEARKALRALADKGEWIYDSTAFRLFRWYSFAGNAAKEDKYVQYSSVPDSIFSLTPGRLLWVKTRHSKSIDFGRGVTLDLKKSYSMRLQANTWTDIALPFKFNITIGDVLDSTRTLEPRADSLRICRWSRDTVKNYVTNEVYFLALGAGDLQDKAAVFLAEQTDGNGVAYSVFNPFDKDIQLKIPPIPAMTSRYKRAQGKRTQAQREQGAIIVEARTLEGSMLNTVYCGLGAGRAGKRFFPSAPTLSGNVALRVCDERMRQFGHMAATGAWDRGEGLDCGVAVNNRSPKNETVKIAVSGRGGLPRDMRFMFFDPIANSFTETGEDGVLRAKVGVGAGEVAYYQLIAGNGEYCAKVKQQAMTMKTELIGMYPNPFRQAVRIRYGLPFGFMGKVQFHIFDACGRQIWNAMTRGHSGTNEVVWTGKKKGGRFAAAGLYILRMTAFNAKGERLGIFERKLTYLP